MKGAAEEDEAGLFDVVKGLQDLGSEDRLPCW